MSHDDIGRRAGEQSGLLPPALYVVATPIGNARDITLRALDVLGAVAVIACEDTRTTGSFLARHGIRTSLIPYHEHNAEAQRPAIVARIAKGDAVALVSDAGTPLISDPGYKLVKDCIAAGLKVVPLPGASATMAALAVAGLPTDRFLFAGFLPPKAGARRNRVAELRAVEATLVLYEAPHRLAETLADLAAGLGARSAAVTRELTKLHEEVRRGTLADLAAHYAAAPTPKGEITLVIAPPEVGEAEASAAATAEMLDRALETMSPAEAARAVAAATGRPKREIYALALERKRGDAH